MARDEARSIRAQVPHEFGPDVERIQQQMQRLGERLSDLSRGALVPYDPAQRLNEVRAKTIRYVTEEDVRVARVRPNEIIALGAPHGRQAGAEGMDVWDEAAASALTQLYESGEAFTKAAERLHMAQPALSQLVRELEHELGIRLFDRTTRRVELTEGGREFHLLTGSRAQLHHQSPRGGRKCKYTSVPHQEHAFASFCVFVEHWLSCPPSHATTPLINAFVRGTRSEASP